MKLSLQNFSSLMEGMAATIQGAASSLVDLTVGSVLRALLEANASVVLWVQWLIVEVLAATRLTTSAGEDCDSFGADFSFVRLPAVAATGEVTFSRFTTIGSATVPVGTSVATVGNTQGYIVIADSSNADYDENSGGYLILPGVSSVNVPIVANNTGSSGNILPGMIGLIGTALPGIDAVTNENALAGGLDAESDAAFKVRFTNYLGGLSRATNIAIGSTIAGIQQGLSYSIAENVDQTGGPLMGHFVVTVDDGSGAPATALLSMIQQAIDQIRPVGTSFAVQAPVVTRADISVSLMTSVGADHNVAVAAVAGAWEFYIESLSVGKPLYYTKLAQIAYDSSDSVTNLSGLLLNNGTEDLAPSPFGVVRSGVMAVN